MAETKAEIEEDNKMRTRLGEIRDEEVQLMVKLYCR